MAICEFLKHECKIKEEVTDLCMAIFQKYLSLNKVAFCKEELNNENEELFSVSIHLKPPELRCLIKKKKQEAEELAKKEINDRLLNLGLFDPCDEPNKNENINTNVEVVLKPEEYYSIKQTLVSKKALDRGGGINLELSTIFSIVHISLIYSGIHFIQMVDLMRWFREGRYAFSRDQLNDCQIVKFNKNVCAYRTQFDTFDDSSHKLFSSPISKSYYSHMYLWQFLSLPRLIVPLDAFDELVCRYIYELNLPKAFISRIQMYREIFNPLKRQNCDLWEKYFPIVDDSDEVVMDSSVIEDNFAIRNHNREVIPKSHETYNLYEKKIDVSFTDFPIETKAMALILFALKREFSFIKRFEFDRKGKGDSFCFSTWLKQLNMRCQLADGKSVNYVISERSLQTFDYEFKYIFREDGNFLNLDLCDDRESHFDHQIPSKNRILLNQNSLSDCLQGMIDVPRNSENEDVLFTPVKFYGEECIYDNELQDDETLLLIKKDFSNFELNDFDEVKERGYYLFPAANGVTCIKQEKNINVRTNKCRIYFSLKKLLPVYDAVKDELSPLFNQLLFLLSKIIGEWPHVLYFTFLAVENAIVFRDEYEEFKKDLEAGKRISMGVNEMYRYRYFLSLDKSEGSFFDFNMVYCFYVVF